MQLGSRSVTNIRRGVGDQMAAGSPWQSGPGPTGFLAEAPRSGEEGRRQVGRCVAPCRAGR